MLRKLKRVSHKDAIDSGDEKQVIANVKKSSTKTEIKPENINNKAKVARISKSSQSKDETSNSDHNTNSDSDKETTHIQTVSAKKEVRNNKPTTVVIEKKKTIKKLQKSDNVKLIEDFDMSEEFESDGEDREYTEEFEAVPSEWRVPKKNLAPWSKDINEESNEKTWADHSGDEIYEASGWKPISELSHKEMVPDYLEAGNEEA